MPSSDHPVCLLVALTCVPGKRADFLARVRMHAASCLAEEPGCFRFDVLVPEDDDDTVFLYEVYADDDAIATHLGTDRMAQYMRDVEPFLADRLRRKCTVMEGAA